MSLDIILERVLFYHWKRNVWRTQKICHFMN